MALTIERIKKYRRWFAWGFAGSVVLMVLLFFAIPLWSLMSPSIPPEMESGAGGGGGGGGGGGSAAESPTATLDTASLLAVGSVLSSFTTLIGLVITTLITWRKERRESDHANIELERKMLELEKLRREVGDKNAAAQEKKKKMTKRRRVV